MCDQTETIKRRSTFEEKKKEEEERKQKKVQVHPTLLLQLARALLLTASKALRSHFRQKYLPVHWD